jgi:hypothetical protein
MIEQVVLEPLIKLEGSQIKVRKILWSTIDKQNPDMIRRFIQLGEQLAFYYSIVNECNQNSTGD